MPMIPRLTESIIANSIPASEGWNLLQLTAVREQKARTGDSMNYFFDFTCIQGPSSSDENKGRSVNVMISGKSLEMGMEDACATYSQMLSALTKMSAKELENKDIDTAQLVGLKMWGDTRNELVDGRIYKRFKSCSPEDIVPF